VESPSGGSRTSLAKICLGDGLENRRLCHLLERSRIRNQTPQKALRTAYQNPPPSAPTARWDLSHRVPPVKVQPRTATAKPGAVRCGGRPRVRSRQAGRPGRRGPYGPGPVVSVSYSAGHGRLAGEWGVCLGFGGNNISVLGVGGDTYGYP
jgi:hypothetical protein